MAGDLKVNRVQLGDDATATRNLVIRTNQDGTFTLARGNVGATTQDILTVDANGRVAMPQTVVAFSAYLNSASQSLANATLTKIALNAEEFDTASCFDSTTNYRFTPNVAGYYILNGQVYIASGAGNNYFCTVYKNGVESKRGQQLGPNPSGATATTVTALVYLNGTTDYVELYAQHASGGAANVNGNNPVITYFQGHLVAKA